MIVKGMCVYTCPCACYLRPCPTPAPYLLALSSLWGETRSSFTILKS